MADGGSDLIMRPGNGAWSSHLKSVMGFPYMPNLQQGVIEVSKPGACDPDMKQLLARLSPYRFATVAFRATRTAGGDLLIAKATYTIFDKGTGQAGTGGFLGTVTGSETNAVEEGGLVPSGTRWYSVGCMTNWQAAYQVAAGGDAAGARFYPVNLQSPVSSYSARIARALADSTYGEINHGTGNACRYSIGPLGLWNNAVADGSQAFDKQGGEPGSFTWFSTPDESTGKNEDGALRMTIEVTRDITIEQDAFNPTTAGQDVILPMKISLMGFPLCEPGTCKVDGGTVDMEVLSDKVAGKLYTMMKGNR